MKNSRRKYMKGGADEEKKSSGFLGMLGLGGKKDEMNTNNGTKSMITDLTNTAKGAMGMPQSGESMTSHLNGEIEKLKKEKIDLENKFKSDVQKMNEENRQKQEAETKKMQDDLNNKLKDLETKISEIMQKKQDVIAESQKNIADSEKPASISVGGGRRRNISHKRNKSHKKRSIKKNRKTRKKKYHKKTYYKNH